MADCLRSHPPIIEAITLLQYPIFNRSRIWIIRKRSTLLATLPIVAMLLLLIIGYGQFGLRIEPLLLVSAAIAAALAWWQGYRWDDIIEAIVAKLAKAMPVILILICVGGLIGTWMISGTIPYMVYWG